MPELNYPIYTAAMKGLVVTCSGLDKHQKEQMKLLIERMAGVYSSAFHDGVTHLVTAKVMSAKYEVAVRMERPVMLPAWVEEVWRVSSAESVTAVEPRFRQLKCPAMQGVTVCVSQMNKADKELIRKTLETHGGCYNGVLDMDKTSVLVCTSPAGDKYAHAKKWKIPCVTSSWVMDSIDRGYCQPTEPYRVDRGKTSASTPTKQDQTVAGLAEVSMCSTILDPDETMAARSVEDTINSTALNNEAGGLVAAIKGKTTADWLAELELGKVKKAGGFLDGCRIFLSGFSESDQVQLARVLKFAGGVRLTQLVESVSHVVQSVDTCHVVPDTARLLASVPHLAPHMVSVQWLVESLRLGRPAAEADHPWPPASTDLSPGPPPLLPPVTRGQTAAPEPAPAPGNDTTQFERRLLAQYGGGEAGGNVTSMTNTEDMSQVPPFLVGKKVNLAGFDEETLQDYTDWITEAGGDIPYTDYTGVLDYFIVPVDKDMESKHEYKLKVTNNWLDDCLDEGKLLPVQYHHKPITVPGSAAPLAGVVTCVSGYNGRERTFLCTLVTRLGGLAQDIFAKKDNKAKATRGSTHLLCPEPEGQKYAAAMKWGLPVVSRDWAVACCRDLAWVSELSFLVGESTTVTPGKPAPSDPEPEKLLENDETVTKDETMVDLATDAKDETMKEEDAEDMEEVTFGQAAPNMTVTPAAVSPLRRTPASDATTPSVARSALTAVATPGPAGLDTPTLERLRPKPIDVNNISVTPQRFPDSQPSPSQRPGGGRSAEAGPGAGGHMATPKTPYGAHWSADPSPGSRKYYKKVLEGLPRQELSEIEINQMERFRNQDPEAFLRSKSAKLNSLKDVEGKLNDVELTKKKHEEYLDNLEARGVPVVARDKRSFEEIMEEKYQKQGKSWKNIGDHVSKKARLELDSSARAEEGGAESRVLAGVVVAVARKLQAQAEEVHQCVEQLGGAAAWSLTDAVTHLVFLGRANDLSKEYRRARELGCHVVAPDWVFMCRDEGERIPESTFPHTYNPKKKLELTQDTTLPTPRSARTLKSAAKPKLAAPAPPLETVESMDTVEEEARAADSTELDDTVAPPTDTMKVTEAVMENMAEINDLLGSVNGTPAGTSKTKSMRAVLTTQDNFKAVGTPGKGAEGDTSQEAAKEESQVQWRDMEEEQERRRLAEQLSTVETQDLAGRQLRDTDTMAMDTMGSLNVSNLTAMMEPEVEVRRVFLMSGWSEGPEVLGGALAKLGGGTLLDCGGYDESVSHMLTARVSRSEKMLGSVAAGKWVLHPSYVTDSVAAARWLPEAKYEWGNADNGFIEDRTSLEWRLASAARRWRLNKGGAFDGMKFIIHMPEKKAAPFSR